MNKRTYLALILATTLAPLAANAGSVHDTSDPAASIDDRSKKDVTPPDFAGKPDGVPPDFAGKPDDVPPDFAGKPDGVPPDFAGKPDGVPPDFAGKPDDVPPVDTSAVPIPAAVWLLGSGLVGLIGIARRRTMTA